MGCSFVEEGSRAGTNPRMTGEVEAIGKSMMRARGTDPMSGFPAGRPAIPEFPGVPALSKERMKQISQQAEGVGAALFAEIFKRTEQSGCNKVELVSRSIGTAPMAFVVALVSKPWPMAFVATPKGTVPPATSNEHRLLVARAGSCGAAGLRPRLQRNTQCVGLATQRCIQRPTPPAP